MKEKERKRVLDNFYIKEMKKGKAKRAYIFDKIALWIIIFFLGFFLLNKVIDHILITFIVTMGITIYLGILSNKGLEKVKLKKIEKIKSEYRKELIEEKELEEDEDVDDYVIKNYKKRKKEFKENIDIYTKGKAIKMYILSIVFFIGSYFIQYSIYYKIMGVIAFAIASFIASRKLTQYIREKDNNCLLDEDNRV